MNLDFVFKFQNYPSQLISPYKIRFTCSINNQTSTLTANFHAPKWFINSKELIENTQPLRMILITQSKMKFSTTNIKLIWVKGKPVLIQTVFLITSKKESILLKRFFNEVLKFNKELVDN